MHKLNLYPLLFLMLTAVSGCGGSEDTAVISGGNTAPVANAGADQSVFTGATVILDGSASSDADGDAIGYKWSMQSQPVGSTSFLSTATEFNPSFVADVDGSYTVSLVVNDGTLDSPADTVVVTASATGPTGSIAAGKVKYDADCASCHAAGTYDVTTSSGANDLYNKGELLITDISSYAPSKKSGVVDLTDQEIQDLYAFLEDPATNAP